MIVRKKSVKRLAIVLLSISIGEHQADHSDIQEQVPISQEDLAKRLNVPDEKLTSSMMIPITNY